MGPLSKALEMVEAARARKAEGCVSGDTLDGAYRNGALSALAPAPRACIAAVRAFVAQRKAA